MPRGLTVLFKQAHLATELRESHPDLRKVLGELEEQLKAWGLPSFTVTDAHRTQRELEEIYTAKYMREGMATGPAKKMAGARRSWHVYRCAVDFRNHDYADADRDMILGWLRNRCPRPMWEVLEHVIVGNKPHFHLGRRDFEWRRKFEAGTV